ncbi:putative flavin-containing polyamine oxidase [Annulohypoxylon truncatum]|uniref:putative flavin-containing polyamine oxidase n=1 Tax=Annulohypoxylon truncatum TaxID=327061 RepID=UPI00200786D2|nr:putative flavin-containing polyamine oxidase [Annulohypoxylon truncatum]KAI1213152.1 putative flavin-containing polyamine oxidase [Annulohypoxylon truncatum]
MRFTDRRLLAACCALVAPLGCTARVIERGGHNATECRKTTVAVLGAGVAGITAAQALSNASVSDFLIIDRNDYIGGRVRHTNFGKKPDGTPYVVELGANWVQGLGSEGGPENPVWTLTKKYGVNNTYSNYSSILTYDETGANDYSDLFDSFENAYGTLEQDAGYILTQNLQDTSIRAGLSLAGWKPKKDMHAQALEWWEWDWETSYPPEQSGELFGITGYNLTYYQFSDANNFVWDQRGFNTWVIGEAYEFLKENDPRLLLETVVKGITYGPEGVIVQLEDGGCIEAQHAITTFSVGVLQNEVVEFDPPLPQWKRAAIEQFQMGTYTKIFLQFNETFWDRDTQFFLYADPDTRGYYPVWQSLSAPGFIEESNIIFVTVVGDKSYHVEQQSDEVTKAEVMAVIRAMFPDIEIPDPIDFMYPRWSLEEWSYGSYSNWPVGMTLEKHQNLRANLDRLWFAGEATSAQYYGFLHGAWYEGRDVGERVAGLVKKTKSHQCDSNSTIGCGTMTDYKVLHGTTSLKEYTVANGWPVSSFLTYGYEE